MRCSASMIMLIVFLCINGMAYAQVTSIKKLKGKVHSSNKDVVGVVVQNINSAEAVITDVNGNFSIPLKLNDTLVFSAVQFKRKILPINNTIYNTGFITVPLEEFVNELDEVVVKPYNLTGNLGQDLGGLKLEKDVSAEALGLPNAHVRIPTQSERKLQEASSGIYSLNRPFRVGINPIVNAITGRTKMLRNRVKVDAQYARTQRVQEFYIDSLLVSTLKIPMEKIDDFMYFCEVDEDFQVVVDSKDKLRIWDFMVEKSRVYRKNNDID